MKKKFAVIGAIVVVVVAVVLIMNGMKSSDDSMGGMNMSGSTQSSSAAQAVATDSVKIKGFAFSPATIRVKAGTTVTWTNDDAVAHTVTEEDGQMGPKSSRMNAGDTYHFTYTKKGTFHYKCDIHEDMKGTVIVD